MDFAIRTENLSRIYKIRGGKKSEPKELVALRDVSVQIRPGELFGLLGPNGAGKTTLIKILTTLLAPTTGRAWVSGLDVVQDPEKVRPRINMVSGGEASGYGLLTVRENLWMFSQFYGLPSAEANRRIKLLLDVVGIGDRLNTKSSDLSTGLRQKMNIVRGFLTDPEVLFLDEPTLGLDVGASRDVRKFIRQWVDEDNTRTLLLTTHYMVEADELCDRVAIINQGKVLACDTPANLKRQLQREAIFRLEVSPLNGLGTSVFETMPGVKKVVHSHREGGSQLEFILEEEPVLGSVVTTLTAGNVRILNLQKREPTLEDVFVNLVGRSMEEVESDSPSPS
ncbi:MAG TPA: ABC transporter ATP-binding protein [Anaerolineales bacterium]|jgi:ABC-2 type transport system ATP-binding protein|nr:ABC transporter ATP-binding protein [Anaerolineales bacterium]